MIFIKEQFATVWEVEDHKTYATIKMSTGRKDKKTEKFINSSWGFVRFVGKAYDKSSDLEERDRINILSGGISREPYEKDGEKVYPKQPQIVVFDFDWVEPKEEEQPKKKTSSKPKKEEKEDEFPF